MLNFIEDTWVETTPCKYDSDFVKYDKAIVGKDGKYGLIDEVGNTIIEPIYEKVDIIWSNLFLAKNSSSAKLYNKMGAIKLDREYEDISTFGNPKNEDYNFHDKLKAVIGSSTYLIDGKGVLLSNESFNDIISVLQNLVVVAQKDRCGVYDLDKKELVVPYSYDFMKVIGETKLFGIRGNKTDFIELEKGPKITTY